MKLLVFVVVVALGSASAQFGGLGNVFGNAAAQLGNQAQGLANSGLSVFGNQLDTVKASLPIANRTSPLSQISFRVLWVLWPKRPSNSPSEPRSSRPVRHSSMASTSSDRRPSNWP